MTLATGWNPRAGAASLKTGNTIQSWQRPHLASKYIIPHEINVPSEGRTEAEKSAGSCAIRILAIMLAAKIFTSSRRPHLASLSPGYQNSMQGTILFPAKLLYLDLTFAPSMAMST